MPEHGDRHLAAIVPFAEGGEIGRQRIGDDQRVGGGIRRKQAAVVAPDVQWATAFIYRAEQSLKIVPEWFRNILADLLGRAFQKAVG
jgi:hypothetical protein